VKRENLAVFFLKTCGFANAKAASTAAGAKELHVTPSVVKNLWPLPAINGFEEMHEDISLCPGRRRRRSFEHLPKEGSAFGGVAWAL
jgi:hypothetical protein